jgi:hypothetical protein
MAHGGFAILGHFPQAPQREAIHARLSASRASGRFGIVASSAFTSFRQAFRFTGYGSGMPSRINGAYASRIASACRRQRDTRANSDGGRRGDIRVIAASVRPISSDFRTKAFPRSFRGRCAVAAYASTDHLMSTCSTVTGGSSAAGDVLSTLMRGAAGALNAPCLREAFTGRASQEVSPDQAKLNREWCGLQARTVAVAEAA